MKEILEIGCAHCGTTESKTHWTLVGYLCDECYFHQLRKEDFKEVCKKYAERFETADIFDNERE